MAVRRRFPALARPALMCAVLAFSAQASLALPFWWRGDLDGNWNRSDFFGANTNWSSVSTGLIEAFAIPGVFDTVIFAGSTSANLFGFLSSNLTISTLQVAPGFASAGGVGGAGFLTLDNGQVRHDGNATFSITTPLLLTTGSAAFDLRTTSAGSLLVGSNLTGSRALNVTTPGLGFGRVILTGNGDHTGGTTVSSNSILQVGNLGTSGALNSNVTLASSLSRLVFSRSVSHTHSNSISGPGLVEMAGAGTLTMNGAVTAQAGVLLTSGTYALGSAGAFPSSRDVSVAQGSMNLAGNSITVGSIRFREASGSGAQRSIFNSGAAATVTLTGDVLYEGASANGGTVGVVNVPLNLSAGTHTVTNPNGGFTGSSYDIVFAQPLTGPGSIVFSSYLFIGIASPATMTGVVTVNAFSGGVVALGAPNALATATGVVVNDGRLNLNPAANSEGVPSGNFDQTFKYLEGTGGTITLGTATLTVGDASNRTFAGQISGTGGKLVKQGTGTLTLAGLNDYSGGTILRGGTLKVGFAGGLPELRDVVLGLGTLDIAGFSPTLGNLDAEGGAGVRQVIDSVGGGIITVTGDIRYTATVGSAGSVAIINAPLLLPAGVHAISNPNGAFSSSAYDFEILRDISGPGTLSLQGTIFAAIARPLSMTGPIVINAPGGGMLFLATSNALSGTAGVRVDAGTLRLNPNSATANIAAGNFDQTLKYLEGTGGIVSLGSAQLTVGDASSRVYAGRISGGGGRLVKQGTGILTLAGTSVFTGGTTISGGTLRLGSLAAFPTGTQLLMQSGTFDLGGNGATLSKLQIASGFNNRTITNTSAGSATLTLAGDIEYIGESSSIGVTPLIISTSVTFTGVNPAVRRIGTSFQARNVIFNAPLSAPSLTIDGGSSNLFIVAFTRPSTISGPVRFTGTSSVILGVTNALPQATSVTLEDSSALSLSTSAAFGLQAGNFNQSIRTVQSQSESSQISFGSANLQLGVFSGSETSSFAGVLFADAGASLTLADTEVTLTSPFMNRLTYNLLSSTLTLGRTDSATNAVASGSIIVDPESTLTFKHLPTPAAHTRLTGGIALDLQGNGGAYSNAGIEQGTLPVTPTSPRAQKPSVLVLDSLTMSENGGAGFKFYYTTLYLNGNDAIVRAGTTTLADVTNMVRGGLNNPQDTGLITAIDDDLYRLAVILNSTFTPGVPYFNTFDGIAVSSTDILVRTTYIGDADLNGIVDGNDLALAIEGYSLGLTGWRWGDFDYSGTVTASDIAALVAVLNTPGLTPLGSPADASTGPGGAVPEPTGLGLLAAATVPLLSRRRRNTPARRTI